MASASLDALELWYRAAREPIGIKVQTNDALRLKAKLYAARKAAEDPDLAALMIQTSPLNQKTEVWITHRIIEIDEAEGLTDVER